MTSPISVSIVIPVLNRATTISDTLNGLIHQIGAPQHKEILVVDGGSTDGTQEIVRKFGVTLLEQRKPGIPAARNVALKNASGDLIVSIDADEIPSRHWLRELVKPFNDPNAMLAGGSTLDLHPRTAAQRYFAASGLHDPRNSIFRDDFPFVAGGNMAVRRGAALSINGWSEEFIVGEDIDFSCRMMRKFLTKPIYVPNAVVFHSNRNTDEELRRQAWLYGEGAAHIYLHYPDVLRWDWINSIKLAWTIARRTIRPVIMRPLCRLGLVSSEHTEFAYYHRFWTWWFWRGFFSMRRNHEYKALPPSDSFWSMQPAITPQSET